MVLAVDAVRPLRGGSQSQLMLGADGRLWVVKFQNNPQHLRVLANELIAGRLAEAVGLSVAATEIIDVPESLTANHPSMMMELTRGRKERYLPGQQFGSAFVGGLMPGLVVDFLQDDRLREVRNLDEYAGMLAFDKWTGNCDGRQAVFHRTYRESRYRAMFIDQGFCFNAAEWNFPDNPHRGVCRSNVVYAGVKGWSSFEPWLSRIEAMDLGTLSRIVESVPPLWYENNTALVQQLINDLLARRGRVRKLIEEFRNGERFPFPLWR